MQLAYVASNKMTTLYTSTVATMTTCTVYGTCSCAQNMHQDGSSFMWLQPCNNQTVHCFGGYSKARCVKLLPLIHSHVTEAQWVCVEAEDSCHCQALRALLKMRHSTSSDIIITTTQKCRKQGLLKTLQTVVISTMNRIH